MPVIQLLIKLSSNRLVIILAISALFLCGILMGAIMLKPYKHQMSEIHYYRDYDNESCILNILNIVKSNLITVLVLLSGVFLFCLTTFIGLVKIGLTIGVIISSVPVSPYILLAGLLPHGLFELAAYFYVAYNVMCIQPSIYRLYITGNENAFRNILLQLLKCFVLSVVLIVIAAFIEVLVTPKLLSLIR